MHFSLSHPDETYKRILGNNPAIPAFFLKCALEKATKIVVGWGFVLLNKREVCVRIVWILSTKEVDIDMIKKYKLMRRGLAATLALSTLLLSGCQMPAVQTLAPTTEAVVAETEVTEAIETAPTETEPEVTNILPDGNPDDVTCKGTYSATNLDVLSNAHNVVATVGDAELTNVQLQIYYWMAVNTYRAENHEIAPDWNVNLDEQLCALTNSDTSWQQYFLQSALDTWHHYQAAVSLSQETVFDTEEAYSIDEKKHQENISEETAYLDVLYGYNAAYSVDPQHQAHLDQLEDMLEHQAEEAGYASLSDLVLEMAGMGTTPEYLVNYAKLANLGYMFLSTLYYYVEAGKSEVTAYYEANAQHYEEAGITADSGKSVTIRHILIDGTKSNAESTANSLLTKYKKYNTEVYFGELAYQNSDDLATYKSGGLYYDLHEGQLTGDLNTWCFAEERQPGDVAVVKSDAGYHVVYFQSATERWYVEAERDLLNQQLCQLITTALETYPMTVDYRSISLCNAGTHDLAISVEDMLYPDVAHQRYYKVPLYFQQDYGDSKYGDFSLRTYGCGITTISMLTSYMKDEEYTPPYMGIKFGKYCSENGTAYTLMTEAPAAMDYYSIRQTNSWTEAKAALAEGYFVITLQHGGYWTRGGHYLLITSIDEEGHITVRDSNLYNYGKLKGHKDGYFDQSTIPANAAKYWIYEKKVVNVETCFRCGTIKDVAANPALAMFAGEYHCIKCQNAMERKSAYVDLCI